VDDAYCTDHPEMETVVAPRLYSSMKSLAYCAPELPPPPYTWLTTTSGEAAFAGFVGLAVPRFEAHFTPAVEVGWRLDAEWWGRGYATEAAREALRFGFTEAGLAEIVSFTAPANEPSRAVMRRIGMTHDPAGDFDHPALPPGHHLRRHVLYRLTRDRWSSS